MSLTAPDSSAPASPDWLRIFPDADHRWTMGLRPGELSEFFQPRDPHGQILAERGRWLSETPSAYAALQPAAHAPLRETIELAQSLGAIVPQGPTPWDQLLSLGRVWEPDFVWMVPTDAATWALAGGAVCFPSSWSMPEKLGQPLSEIHTPVPGLNPALEKQIDTFLNRMQPGQAWFRENAGFSRDNQRNHLPSRPRQRLDATVKVAEVFIRVEHQLLYKLPQSGAILFGIRVEVFPLQQLLADPLATARLRRMLATLTPDKAHYKGISASLDRLIEILESASRPSD
jgi:hypothetical protein